MNIPGAIAAISGCRLSVTLPTTPCAFSPWPRPPPWRERTALPDEQGFSRRGARTSGRADSRSARDPVLLVRPAPSPRPHPSLGDDASVACGTLTPPAPWTGARAALGPSPSRSAPGALHAYGPDPRAGGPVRGGASVRRDSPPSAPPRPGASPRASPAFAGHLSEQALVPGRHPEDGPGADGPGGGPGVLEAEPGAVHPLGELRDPCRETGGLGVQVLRGSPRRFTTAGQVEPTDERKSGVNHTDGPIKDGRGCSA